MRTKLSEKTRYAIRELFYSIGYYGNTINKEFVEAIEVLTTEKYCSHISGYRETLTALEKIITKEQFKTVFELYLECAAENKDSHMIDRDIKLFINWLDLKTVEKSFLASSLSENKKLLLLFGNTLSKEDEILMLRGIKSSYGVNDFVRESGYKIRLDSIKQLPPIMRMKVIESFVNSSLYTEFNPFSEINEEDFTNLLFSSGLRYTGRVKDILENYKAITSPPETTWNVTCNCTKCGKYSFILKNIKHLTKKSLNDSVLDRVWCMLCSTRLEEKTIIEEVTNETR